MSTNANDRAADDVQTELVAIRRRLSWLTVAVFFVGFTLLLTVTAVFGNLVNYFYGESKLVASAAVGGAAMGFLFGWLACRAAAAKA